MKKFKTKRKGTNKGFSLIEVLCAIVLLGLIAAPFIQMVYSSYTTNQKSKKYLAAADLSQTIAEAISSQTWEGSEGTVHSVDGDGNPQNKTVEIPGLKEYYFEGKYNDYYTAEKGYPIYRISIPDPDDPNVFNETLGIGAKGTAFSGYSNYDGQIDNSKDDDNDPHSTLDTSLIIFTDSFDAVGSPRFYNYYFSGVEYGKEIDSVTHEREFKFNVWIQFDVGYDLTNNSSKEYYVINCNIYIFDFAYEKDTNGNYVLDSNDKKVPYAFNTSNVASGKLPLIESVSTSVANKK